MIVAVPDVLARAGDSALEALVGTEALRLLGALDPGLVTPRRLRDVALGLHGARGLVLDAASRDALVRALAPADARAVQAATGAASGDPYAALQALRVSAGSTRERALLDAFGLAPAPPDDPPPPSARPVAPAYGLFPHQQRAADAVWDRLHTDRRRVLLHMPTGAGKTRTAMTVVARHLRERPDGVVVWLAASEELCEQAAAEFERAWASLGHQAATVTRFWGAHDPPLGDAPPGIVVAGLAKLVARARGHLADLARLGSRATLVVFDEAHQAVARTYRLVTETLLHVQYEPPGLLGLSATPGRTWNDPDTDARLADFFDRTKVTLEVDGYASPVDYLVDHGYLARPAFRSLFVHNGAGLSDADLARVRDGLDVPDDVLRRLAEDEQRSLGILVEIEALLARHDRVLVFATTVWHAELLAVVLRARGHDAASVTGTTPGSDRAERIARFRAPGGPAQVLCNVGVLTTGFDAPRTSAALIARPTRSLVLYSQMVGRAIRGPRAGGQPHAEIVTVVDTALPGFGTLADAFSNWEDVWT